MYLFIEVEGNGCFYLDPALEVIESNVIERRCAGFTFEGLVVISVVLSSLSNIIVIAGFLRKSFSKPFSNYEKVSINGKKLSNPQDIDEIVKILEEMSDNKSND